MNPKRYTSWYNIIKMATAKGKKNIKVSKRKTKQIITYKGNTGRLQADFSAETLQARKEWQDIIKVLKGKIKIKTKNKKPNQNTVSAKVIIWNWKRDKQFPSEALVYHH